MFESHFKNFQNTSDIFDLKWAMSGLVTVRSIVWDEWYKNHAR